MTPSAYALHGLVAAEARRTDSHGQRRQEPLSWANRSDACLVNGVGPSTAAGDGLGPGGVDGGWSGAVRERSVRPLVVAVAGERVEQSLELADGGGGRLAGQKFLEGLLEPSSPCLGSGVVRLAVLLVDTEAAQLGFQAVAAACHRRTVWW
jgi:hypothetical protein